MQQGLTTVLANPFAVRDMDHAIGRDALGVEGHAITQTIARVLLEQVIGLYPSPTVTLNALGNTLGQVRVTPRQVVRFQQLQGKRHVMQVLIIGHPADQHLGQPLTVAQPSTTHQALHLRPRQLPGGLRRQRPLRPLRLDRGGKL